MGTAVPPPLSPAWLVADALARVVAIRSALEGGQGRYALELADRLECTLHDLRARLEEAT